MNQHIKYRRVIIKISGEALAGKNKFGIDAEIVSNIAQELKKVYDMGVEIGIVVGGGNFWRGRSGKALDRTTSDHMGMLATVINSLALQDALEAREIPTRVQTSIEMRQIAEPYIRRKAINHLSKKRIVIFACGTGSPYFSTDTAAALRAAEVDADIVLFAKSIDGVYDSDPAINPDAKKFDKISYLDILKDSLGVMDSTAASLCKDNNIPIIVFGLDDPDNIRKVICGDKLGTAIT